VKTQALIDVKKELEEKDSANKQQDQEITNQINQNYLAGALSGGIAVYPEVRNGVVILHGRVPDAATAERAIAAARKTTGVQRIISNLVILNQPAGAGAPPQQQAMPANVPPEYQQQYQQFMQQYQQGAPMQQYPQIQMQQAPQQQMMPQAAPQPVSLQQQKQWYHPQPAATDPAKPVKIKYEQIFNHSLEKGQPAYAAVGKERSKVAKPPGEQASNNSSKAKNSTPHSSPKLLSPQTLKQYSDQDEAGYALPGESANIRHTATATPVVAAPAAAPQQKVIFVPVPVPTADNDTSYRGLGDYNPHRVSGNGRAPATPKVNIPVQSDEDNDFSYSY
jgi:hypothetical protein